MTKIVVGIDGSDASERALVWAAAEARLRGAHLYVVHSWLEVFVDGYFTAPAIYARDEIEGAGQELLDKAIASIPDGAPELRVEGVLAHAQPANAILDAASDADLVVVGSRGRGTFAGALMGSVSHRVVQHAPCPVVVVR